MKMKDREYSPQWSSVAKFSDNVVTRMTTWCAGGVVDQLDGYLSEAELAAELDLDIRTIQRWRKLRKGPPFIMAGIRPFYHIELARKWIAAGGTAATKPKPAPGPSAPTTARAEPKEAAE